MTAAGRRPHSRSSWPRAAVVALLLLPLAYLAIRVAGGGTAALDVLWDDSTARLVVEHGPPGRRRRRRRDRRRRPDGLARHPDRPPGPPPVVGRGRSAARHPELRRGLLPARALRRARAPAAGARRRSACRTPPGTGARVAALTLSTYPYVFLLTQAALRDLDPSLEEAARGLGLTRTRALLRVTVPAVRPSVALGSLLVALYVLSDFGVVSLDALRLVDAGDLPPVPEPLRPHPRRRAGARARGPHRNRTRPRAARTHAGPALAHRRRGQPAGRRRSRSVAWRYLALGWCCLVTAVFLLLPAGVLAYWLGRGIANERALSLPVEEALSSLGASSLAAVVTLLASLPVAVLVSRYPTRFSRTLERLSYRRKRAPRARDRALARLLRRSLRVARLPDARRCSSSRTPSVSSPRRSRRSRRRSHA